MSHWQRNSMRIEAVPGRYRRLIVTARTLDGTAHTYQTICHTEASLRAAIAFWIQRLHEAFTTGKFPIYQERTASENAWLAESRRRIREQMDMPLEEYGRLYREWEAAEGWPDNAVGG